MDSTVSPAQAESATATAPCGQAAATASETLGAQLRDVMLESAAQHAAALASAPLISAATALASAAAYSVSEAGLDGATAHALAVGSGAPGAGAHDMNPAGEWTAPAGSEQRLADDMMRMVSPFPMALLGAYAPSDGARHVPVHAIQDAVRRLGERHPDIADDADAADAAADMARPSSRTDGPARLLESLAAEQISPLGMVCEIRPSYAAADGVGNGFDIVTRASFPVALGRLSLGPYPLDFDASPPSQGGVRFVAGFPVGKPQDYGGYRLDPGFAGEAAGLSLTFPDIDDAAAVRPRPAGASAAVASGRDPAPAPLPPGAGAGSRPISAAQAAVFARLYLACHADHAMMTAVSGLLGVTKAIYGLVASTCDVFRASDDFDDESDLFFAEQQQYLRLAQDPDFTFDVADGVDQDIAVQIRAVYPVAGYRGDPAAPWRVAHGAGESHVTFATSFSIKRGADTDAAGRVPDAQRETAHWLDRLFGTDSGAGAGTPIGGDKPDRILAVRGATTMSVAIENQWRFDRVSGDYLP
ncbi:MAG: hypothetical protein ACRYHA_11345 [Janthinobacterium lividum]